VEDAGCGPLVVQGVVQHSVLGKTVAGDLGVMKLVLALREGQFLAETVAIDGKAFTRKLRKRVPSTGQSIVQEVLNALINGTQVTLEKSALFAVHAEEIAGKIQNGSLLRYSRRLEAHRREFHMKDELRIITIERGLLALVVYPGVAGKINLV
jgi:hypothetical protein